MREIKFRYTVVRPNGHVFHKDFTIQEMECGDACGWMNANMVGRYVQASELHRRQFTGLKDKNGKEIWEKDKTRCWTSTGETMEGVVEYEDGCFNVVFNEPYYDMGHVRTRDYVKVFSGNHAIEITGSIYENPELVTQ